ncbi:putative DNA repair exonuclease [Candidatus Paraburkholderia kirkii]|nr:putative DNA repair exonuclease [Candidatus Paraburkholderia kirkii]
MPPCCASPTRSRPISSSLSGDITQRARKRQFAAARAFLDALGATPTLVVPGNHDIPLFDLLARLFIRTRIISARSAPIWSLRSNRRDCSCSASIRRDPIVTRTAKCRCGRSGASPRALRRRARRNCASWSRISRWPSRTRRTKRTFCADASARCGAGARAGADLILGGHIHLPYVLPLHDDTFAGLPRRVWAVQAGTALSWRTRGTIGIFGEPDPP